MRKEIFTLNCELLNLTDQKTQFIMRKNLLISFLFISFVIFNSCQQGPVNNKPNVTGKITESKKDERSQINSKDSKQLATASKIIAEVTETDLSKVDAKKIYNLNCATCHGPKGKMSLSGSKKLVESKLDLQNIVAQVYHGKGLMTPYKNVLSESELVAVSNYVKAFQ